MGSTVRYFGVDLWQQREQARPDVRAVVSVNSRRQLPVEGLIHEVMRSHGVMFAAYAVVESLEGSRVISTTTRRNIALDA